MHPEKIQDLFAALGLQVKLEKTQYNKLKSNTTNTKEQDSQAESEELFFSRNHLEYTLNFDLNLSGYMTLLNEYNALATVNGSLIGQRSAFVFKVLSQILTNIDQNNLKLLMNIGEEALEQEGGFSQFIQRSTQAPKNLSQFLVATNETTLTQLQAKLAGIVQTKTRLEIVMEALGLQVSASAFIENALFSREIDESFCLEVPAGAAQSKFFTDLKKLFDALGIEDYEVIRDRLGSKNLSIRLTKNNYEKLLNISPDFLASIEDIVNLHVTARNQGQTLEADTAYNALCHLLNTRQNATKTQAPSKTVPHFSDDANASLFRRMRFQHWKTDDPFAAPSAHQDQDGLPKIYTQLPTPKRYHHLTDWQTTLDAMIFEQQSAEKTTKKGLWTRFKEAFSSVPDVQQYIAQSAQPNVEDSVQLFELSALESNGIVGQCLTHNREILKQFLERELKIIIHENDNAAQDDDSAQIKYLKEWKNTLEQMRKVEFSLYSSLSSQLNAMPPDGSTYSLYMQYSNESCQFLDIYEKAIKAITLYCNKVLKTSHSTKRDQEIIKFEKFSDKKVEKITSLLQEEKKTAYSWTDLEAAYQRKPLPTSSKIDTDSIKEAFKNMGLGSVAIRTGKDTAGNLSYQVTFAKEISSTQKEFLEQQGGMEAVLFDEARVFLSKSQLEGQKKSIEVNKRILTCNPKHMQGFIHQFNTHHQQTQRLQFVMGELLGYPVSVLAPYQSFQQNKQESTVRVQVKSSEEATRIRGLLQKIGIDSIQKDNMLSFNQEALKLLNERGHVFQFFKDISQKIRECDRLGDPGAAHLLNQLLEHLVSNIYAPNAASVWINKTIGDQEIKYFDPDRIKTGSIHSVISQWRSNNQKLIRSHDQGLGQLKTGFFNKLFRRRSPVVAVENFIDNNLSYSEKPLLASIPYPLLFQRHGLVAIQQEQERSIEDMLKKLHSAEINDVQLKSIFQELTTSQNNLKETIGYQVQEKIINLSFDRILTEDLERLMHRAEATLEALQFAHTLISSTCMDQAKIKTLRAHFNEVTDKKEYATFAASSAVFAQIHMILDKYESTIPSEADKADKIDSLDNASFVPNVPRPSNVQDVPADPVPVGANPNSLFARAANNKIQQQAPAASAQQLTCS